MTTTSTTQRSGGAAGAMAFVVGFLPWILYWILVGNVPFTTAVLVALGLSVLVDVTSLVRHRPLKVLEAGTTVVFVVFSVLAVTVPDDVLERWLQPLGNLGLLLIVLASILIGKPFTLQYARESSPPELWDDPGFVWVCRLLAWVWVGAMAVMTAVSAIPPLVDGDATVRDAGDPLSIVCYWVVPFAVLGLAMLFTARFPDWFGEAAGGDEPPASSPAPEAPLPVSDAGDPIRAGGVELVVSPADGLADAAPSVEVRGVTPGADVVLEAETVDGLGRRWASRATFRAAGDGAVDLSRDLPTDGTWSAEADAAALVWSMAPVGDGADLYIPNGAPAGTVVTASLDGGAGVLRTTVVRRTAAAGVRVREIREPTVAGRLFVPAEDGGPAVVLFPGSEGGLDSQSSNAALLASHGCTALVAAPFTAADDDPIDGVPSSIERVPLERFADAVRWLADRAGGPAGGVTAVAISRGAEGLLATASRVPDLPLRRIVAVSPSSATWVGLGAHGSLQGVPAWTLDGADLPAVQTDDDALLADIAREALRRRGHDRGHGPSVLHLVRAYAPRLDDPAATGDAAIAVERIPVPLLLMAGTGDQVWPSVAMARRIVDRRRSSGVPAAADDELHVVEGAGHLVRLGCWPTTVSATGGIDLGGTPAGTANAQALLTARLLQLLAS